MIRCEPNREEGVAHTDGSSIQTVYDHLSGTSEFSSEFGEDIGMPKTCELLGLLHDLGKYSDSFFDRIVHKSPELVDHSTGGAQFVQEYFTCGEMREQVIKQILSLTVMSHHSGLIDIIDLSGKDNYGARLSDRKRSNYDEIVKRIKPELRDRFDALNSGDVLTEFKKIVSKFPEKKPFYYGLLSRFLLSCLVDADRLDTEKFCSKDNFNTRQGQEVKWGDIVRKLDVHLSTKGASSALDVVRKSISEQCVGASGKSPGIYSLNLPTGSGKTLAGLRFALNHAEIHDMKRIIYVAPYTSIIDQNANVVRSVLGEFEGIILEHHSNITSGDDKDDDEASGLRITADNWDSQIIFTTMVQFLNTIFSSGTSSVRRMHNLSRSVIILDEIQSLPIKCVTLV